MKIKEAVVVAKAQYPFCDCGGQLKYSHQLESTVTLWQRLTGKARDAKPMSDIWVCVKCGKDEDMGYSPNYLWPKITYRADPDEAVEVKP